MVSFLISAAFGGAAFIIEQDTYQRVALILGPVLIRRNTVFNINYLYL